MSNDYHVGDVGAVPLKSNRLRCGITFLLELLWYILIYLNVVKKSLTFKQSTTAPRPVLFPVAAVVSLAVAMLRCAPDENVTFFFIKWTTNN